MQRKLHGFCNQRNQHQRKNSAGESVRHTRIGPERTARAMEDHEDGRQQAVARDMRHQQHFARAGNRLAVGVPEAHQAEGAQSDQFPAEIKEKEVGAVNQSHEACDEDQHRRVEACGGLVVGHVADGVKEHECAQACPHQCKEDAEGVHVENKSERAIPVKHVQIDELASLGPSHQSDHGSDGRQTGDKGQNPLGPCVKKPCG